MNAKQLLSAIQLLEGTKSDLMSEAIASDTVTKGHKVSVGHLESAMTQIFTDTETRQHITTTRKFFQGPNKQLNSDKNTANITNTTQPTK